MWEAISQGRGVGKKTDTFQVISCTAVWTISSRHVAQSFTEPVLNSTTASSKWHWLNLTTNAADCGSSTVVIANGAPCQSSPQAALKADAVINSYNYVVSC